MISGAAFFVAIAALTAAVADALVPAGATQEKPMGPMIAQLSAQVVVIEQNLTDGALTGPSYSE